MKDTLGIPIFQPSNSLVNNFLDFTVVALIQTTALIHSLKQSLEQRKSATQRRPRCSPPSSTSATIWYCPSRTTTTVKMANNDINVVITNEGSSKGKVVDIWSDNNVAIFVELMEGEVMTNNRTTTTFTKESWQTIKHELNRRTGLGFSLDQLRNKFNKLRGVYRDFNAILKETGMGYTYDPSTGRIFASDDQWRRLAGVNKHARQFQKYGCPLFGKLCVIYGDTTATSENAHASVHAPSESDESDPIYLPKEEEEVDEDVIEVMPKASKKADKGKRKRGRTEKGSTVDSALQEMASTFADAQ